MGTSIGARFGVSLAVLLTGLAAAPAMAQAPVGGAKDIQNDVQGQTGRTTAKIAMGDQVFQNELVRTGADSLARIAFLDDTTLSIGPTSQVKLDRFVFDASGTGKAVVFTAAKGAFRFFSGVSDHNAYRVQTPQASIGVRGTVYDVRVDPATTTVVLVEGAVNVCVRGTTRCVDLTQAGQSVVVRSNGIDGPAPAGAQNWNFGAYCGSDPAQSPWCTKTTKVGLDLTPKAPPAKPVAKPAPRVRTAKAPPRRRLPVYDDYDEVYDGPIYYRPAHPYYPPVYYGGAYYGGRGYYRGGYGGYRGGFRGNGGGFTRGGGGGRGGGRGR